MIVSITGASVECVEMTKILNGLAEIKGIEFNGSCPNTDPKDAETVIRTCYAMKNVSEHPLLLKLGYAQPYIQIAKAIEGVVEAIDINSVPWDVVYPGGKSPLAKYGGGGVSGKIAQPFTWKMIAELARGTKTPIIGSSVWEYEDIDRVYELGASAIHFGTIFFHPLKPTQYVRRRMCERL